MTTSPVLRSAATANKAFQLRFMIKRLTDRPEREMTDGTLGYFPEAAQPSRRARPRGVIR
jgi:hypothetical protein